MEFSSSLEFGLRRGRLSIRSVQVENQSLLQPLRKPGILFTQSVLGTVGGSGVSDIRG